MALAGYRAIIRAQSSATAFTAEATSTSDDKTYTITDSNKAIFDYDTTLIVLDDGIATTEEYTLSKLNGTVTFDSVDATRVITLTGAYVTLTTVVEGTSFNADFTLDMGDVTVFQDTVKNFKALLLSGTMTIGKFYSIDNYFLDLLFDKEIKVIEFRADSSDSYFLRVFGSVSSDGVGSTVEGLVNESISIQCTDEMIKEA